MRILIKAAFDTSSGYGNDGVGLAMALDGMGEDVRLFPVGVAPPLPKRFLILLEKKLEPPFDICIVHVDPPNLETEIATRHTARKIVGWTMWEHLDYRPYGEAYSENGFRRSSLHRRLKDFDLLISYDPVTAESLGPHVPTGTATATLQGGFWSESWPYQAERDWTGTFRFCMVGQLHQRKDPFAAIEAFNLLKQKHGDDFDAELHLKTNVLGLHPSMADVYPGLTIHYRWWDLDTLLRFYRSAHCLLAPSRGEGKNVPALEAQSTGIPVIASDYGGHQMWLNDEFAYKLPVTITDYPKSGRAARADRTALADLMWHVYTHREEASEKGRIASRTIPAMCDWSVVARRLLETIQRGTEGRPLGMGVLGD